VPSKREIEAGRAFVRLFLKNDMRRQLTGALRSAGNQLKGWGRSTMVAGAGVTAAGTAVLAPLAAAVKSFAAQGDALGKMAARTGIAAGALAELGFAAEQTGSDLTAVEKAVLRMNRRLGRMTVGQGSATEVAAMGELGLSVEQLNRMNPEERFLALADAMAQYGDDAAAAGLAQRAFGTGVDRIIPLLMQGREGIAGLRSEARDLGIVPTEEEVQNAEKVTDAINRVRRAVKAMVFSLGASMAGPALQGLAMMKNIAVSIGQFIEGKGHILVAAAAIGTALVVAGAAVTAFGAVLWGAGVALTALGTVVGVLLSPLGLITAAVVGAGVAFFNWAKSGQAAYNYLSSTFGKLLSWFQEVFGAITDAIGGGDMQLAAEVMWAGIKVAWTKGMQWVRKAWADFAFGTLDTANFLWSELVSGLNGAIDRIVDAWKWLEKSFAKGIGWVLAKLQGLDPDEVMANLGQDYGRTQKIRDAGRAARDQANREAAEARYLANAAAKRAAQAGSEEELQKARRSYRRPASDWQTLSNGPENTDPLRRRRRSVVRLPLILGPWPGLLHAGHRSQLLTRQRRRESRATEPVAPSRRWPTELLPLNETPRR
jgi:hypothetical protein